MPRSRTRTLTVALGAIITACTPDVTDVELVLARSSSQSAVKYSAWSAPVWLGSVVNSISNEQNAQLSKDELSLYFSSDRAGGQGGLDIYVAQRSSVDSPWGPGVNVAALNSPQPDFAPNVSIDGHLLFFASGRLGGHGSADIYVTRRDNPNDDLSWGVPVNIGPDVNTAGAEQAPNYHQNAEEGAANLYFNRAAVGMVGVADLYYAPVSRVGEAIGPGVLVEELSFPGFNDAATVLRKDAKELFFFSNRPGGLGGNDMWTSTRQNANDDWSPPANLGAPLNTTVSDVTPNLSFDGLKLIFGTNRPGSMGGQDIWMATRTRQ
jgi:hypothetical protein